MVKHYLLLFIAGMALPFLHTEKGTAQSYEERVFSALSVQTEIPKGMLSKPLPAQKNLPLMFWGVRTDTTGQLPPIGLQVFGFDARLPWPASERDSMLTFVYQQVFDTMAPSHGWSAFETCPFSAPCFVHYTDTLSIDGEAYLGIMLTSFYAPKQWTWVWYTTAEHLPFLKESATRAWEKLIFTPQNVTDVQQRIRYALPKEWVAMKGKNEEIRLVPRAQINQSVLSEKMGYHTVDGYIFKSDSLFFEDMQTSLQNQGFSIAKRFTWEKFTGFEIHIGRPEDPGTHGLYLFWPPSGRMRWPYGFFYVSTTPLETEKVTAFFSWIDTVRFMEE